MNADNQKKCVLCIDDDPDFLNYLRLVLESSGYSVVEAYTGAEGIKKFKECNPQLVIVDLMMEEVDAGLNFCRELRAHQKSVPIFLLSSVGERFSTSIDTSQLGFDAVLQKPFEEDVLLKLVRAKIG